MNAGLGTLSALKRRLLPPQSLSQTEWDAEILSIGTGVARWFEAQCDRKFSRVVDDLYLCRGDRMHVTLPRYPVEAVTLVEQLYPIGTQWTPCPAPSLLYPQSGLLEFLVPAAPLGSQLRVTFTGGYWFDTSDDHSGLLPTGATPLPEDLSRAWLDQSAFLFENRSRLGMKKYIERGSAFYLENDALVPGVVSILNGYRRYFPI